MPSLPVIDNAASAPRAQIAADLSRLIQGEVRFDPHHQLLYATDASLYQVRPIGLVLPSSTEDVVAVLNYATTHHLALLPRGGGTSLAGQCTNHAVVLDLSQKMRRILSTDPAARLCHVQPGITIEELNRSLAPWGLLFAPDPATIAQASVGGCIGNNAAGARSILYGRTSENVAGIEVALTSGQRLWLEPGAGRRDPAAANLARSVARICTKYADLIRARFPKTVRRNAGYGLDLVLQQLDRGIAPEDLDLSGLICGSEGTLAVTVSAKLKLHPVPKHKGLAICSFATLEDCLDAVNPILTTRPSAVELLDDVVLEAAAGNNECRKYLQWLPKVDGRPPAAVLYVEYASPNSGDEVTAAFAALGNVMGASHFDFGSSMLDVRCSPVSSLSAYTQAKPMADLWALRKAGEPLLHGLAGHRKPHTFVEDNAVPVENLPRFVREFKQIVARHGTKAAYYAHASVGVLHVRPLIDLHDPADRNAMRQIAVDVADLARACGGVMSGEHGDGRVRGPLLERFFGPELMTAFREVKNLFDPANLLNPGNIVSPGPVESITENLRTDRVLEGADLSKVETYFDYEDQEGFRGALEMCNGAGLCRKTATGTMCPSYRATLDERHATRGRGNALRTAVTGQVRLLNDLPSHGSHLVPSLTPSPLAGEGRGEGGSFPNDSRASAERPKPTPQPVWDDPGTIETLDLCLSCKACKSECPSNVDLARLKAEYTAQRYARKGAPLHAKLFGHVRTLNRLGSLVPGLANWFNRLPPVRALTNRLLHLAPQRSIPTFSKSLYARVPTQSEISHAKSPSVVLFGDCFVTYNESDIGLAAHRLLAALGYRVLLPRTGCCGRAMMSTGLLPDAIRTADETLAQLRPHIEDENVFGILVAEPSCLSAFKDDYLQLKLQTPLDLRKKLASKSFLIEEFVDKFWDTHPTPPKAGGVQSPGPVLLHGHCHQKALWGDSTSANLLRRLVGNDLTVIPSGCCGMAGAFGYTADHYDVSMKIGELSLFPPIRSNPNATLLAPGTSCRHQIHDGTGRTALHPIEFAAQLLAPDNTKP